MKIHPSAFLDCLSLREIVFCDEIEAFLSRTSLRLRAGWENGISGKSLRMYSFLAQGNIPERYDGIKVAKWQSEIDNILGKYPSISFRNIESYCNSIDSKLSKISEYE